MGELIMKILLIDPPFQRFMKFYRYYYPIGLAYMAASLDSKRHVVEIYDSEHSAEAETTNWLQAAENYEEYFNGFQNAVIWRTYCLGIFAKLWVLRIILNKSR